MGKLLFSVVFIIGALCCLGQDEPQDVLYVKAKKLDKSYVGRFVQFEFNNQGNDTIVLTVNNSPVQFVARKLANGRGASFYSQYLESTSNVDVYYTVRLVKSRVDEVAGDYILLTNYFDYYAKGNVLAAGKSLQVPYRVNKSMLKQVVVKVDRADM